MASNADTRAAARNRAQSHFAASEQRDASIFADLARARSATENKMAKLKALRLAKEEAERIEKARLAAEAPAKKAVKAKRVVKKAAPASAG